MVALSNRFKLQDKVRCIEPITSSLYNKVFEKGHEFWVEGVSYVGLTVEDEDGFILKNVNFDKFEVTEPRGNYLDNQNGGWHSNRRN